MKDTHRSVAALVVALVALAGLMRSPARHGVVAADAAQDGDRHRHRPLQRQLVQPDQLDGPLRAKQVLKIKTLPLQSNSDAATSRTCDRSAARLGRDHLRRVPHGGRVREGRQLRARARRSSSRSRLSGADPAVLDCKGKLITKNVTGMTFAEQESGCLVGHMAALMVKRQGGPQVISAVGGIKIPPVDVWIAGYKPARRRRTRGSRCSSATRRTSSVGQVQDRRREPDRQGGRPSSRSPVFAASARSRPPKKRRSGASASTSTSTARRQRADERHQARRRGRLPVRQGREDGRAARHRQPHLRPRERRRGSRLDQPDRCRRRSSPARTRSSSRSSPASSSRRVIK